MNLETLPNAEDVERFYARQRREILSRLGAARPLRGRGVRTTLLAAAAMLALAALALALLPDRTLSGPGVGQATEPIVSLPSTLPLSTYGAWSTDEMLDRDDGSEMGGLDWLLDDDDTMGVTTASLPEFLQPFGTWPTASGETNDADSI